MSGSNRIVGSKGFTLIELIVVIVILGVVAAVAAPRYVDLARAAKEAKVKSIAQSLSSGSAMNFAASLTAEQSWAGFVAPVLIRRCTDATRLLKSGTLPTGYSIDASAAFPAEVSHHATTQCDVVSDSDTSTRAAFTLHGVSPSIL